MPASFNAVWGAALVGLMSASVATAQTPAPPPAAPVKGLPQSQAAKTSEQGVKIVLLGTKAGPGIIAERSEPAILLVVNGKSYLIDAGAGVTRQLARAGHQIPSISTILITHLHLDHTGGLAPLIATISGHKAYVRAYDRNDPPVTIYGPPSTKALVDAALEYARVSERIFRAGIPSMAAFDPGAFVVQEIHGPGSVFHDQQVTVTAVENTHFQHPSYGPGGAKDLSLSYRFDTPSGAIVFTGDTGPSRAVTELATGADVLVSEVYQPFVGTDSAEPKDASPIERAQAKQLADHMATEHLTPDEVGKMAARAHVRIVILTHIAAYYDAKNFAAMRAGVRRWFHGPLIIGNDFTTFDLKPRSGGRSPEER